MRNILPIPLLLSLYGMWRARHTHTFLIGAMLAIASLFAIWPVLNLRYLFPAYMLLLAFASLGAVEATRSIRRGKILFMGTLLILILASNLFALCIYSYGACNAWFDRTVGGVLPKNMGLATEGFYTWDQARDWINAHAEPDAEVVVLGAANALAWGESVFREDLNVVADRAAHCPAYEVSQNLESEGAVVFTTEDEPKTSVLRQGCN